MSEARRIVSGSTWVSERIAACPPENPPPHEVRACAVKVVLGERTITTLLELGRRNSPGKLGNSSMPPQPPGRLSQRVRDRADPVAEAHGTQSARCAEHRHAQRAVLERDSFEQVQLGDLPRSGT